MVVYFFLGGGGNIKNEKLVGYIKDTSAKNLENQLISYIVWP